LAASDEVVVDDEDDDDGLVDDSAVGAGLVADVLAGPAGEVEEPFDASSPLEPAQPATRAANSTAAPVRVTAPGPAGDAEDSRRALTRAHAETDIPRLSPRGHASSQTAAAVTPAVSGRHVKCTRMRGAPTHGERPFPDRRLRDCASSVGLGSVSQMSEPATVVAPVPPVTLVTGPEELLRDRAVAEVVRRSRAADPETEVRELEAGGLVAGEITGHASPSLFGEFTVIVVRDVQDGSDDVAVELQALLADPPEGAALVLVHPGGVKGKAMLDAARKAGAFVVEAKQIKWESDKVHFAQSEFATAHRKITADAAAALVDAVGNDLRELASACAQLVADTSGTVDRAVVELYHAGRIEVTGFKVADAAVEGRPEEALRLLRHALATGVDPVPINAVLAAGLRNIARVSGTSRNARPEDVARDLGIAPFQVRKARGQLAGWTPEGISEAITAVAEADGQIKGGGADPVYALERAIVTIGRARRR
jgi:DNA polymerase-3 subunit delta